MQNERKIVIFDIDGTLAKMNDRSPFDWSRVGEDKPKIPIINILKMFTCCCSSYEIFLFSGRDEVCREITENWLYENGIEFKQLFMRSKGDIRKDAIVKKELFNNHIKGKYEVLAVFDDRQQVVDMWRNELGLTCLQVAEGNF